MTLKIVYFPWISQTVYQVFKKFIFSFEISFNSISIFLRFFNSPLCSPLDCVYTTVILLPIHFNRFYVQSLEE